MSDIEERLKNAKALLEGGKGEAARMALLELLKEEPKNPTALLMLGGVYFYEKKYAEAEMVYERLTQSEPGSGMVSIALFNSLWKQGRHEEAAGEIRRFISIADPAKERATIEQYAEISKTIAEDGGVLDE
ncbi:MAG: tetratricopeptide repeat protein [Pseudomonadota bacterium]